MSHPSPATTPHPLWRRASILHKISINWETGWLGVAEWGEASENILRTCVGGAYIWVCGEWYGACVELGSLGGFRVSVWFLGLEGILGFCVNFGFLRGFWVSVWILGLCVDFGSLWRFWVSMWILGPCGDFGSLWGFWVTVWILGPCLCVEMRAG